MKIYKTRAQKLETRRRIEKKNRHRRDRERTREANKRWRSRNVKLVAESQASWYQRNRERILWEHSLTYALLRIRAAKIARGRIPYDG